MTIITHLVAELDREARRSRRALEHVPDHQRDWKPHERSMAFGPLADMVALIPMWVTMILTRDELDVAPTDGQGLQMPHPNTSAEYVEALEQALKGAREALAGTTEAHLQTHWQLKAGGKVVGDTTRLEVLTDTINHWAHHRGQMTVYLRLMGATVPALYGPSADERRFD